MRGQIMTFCSQALRAAAATAAVAVTVALAASAAVAQDNDGPGLFKRMFGNSVRWRAASEFRPSRAEHEVVAAAFTAVTHPVGAAPDQRQAETAERRLGQRFCRGMLRRAGRVERDAGVPYLDARLAGRGLLAD